MWLSIVQYNSHIPTDYSRCGKQQFGNPISVLSSETYLANPLTSLIFHKWWKTRQGLTVLAIFTLWVDLVLSICSHTTGQHQTHHGIRNINDISIAECCLATKYLKQSGMDEGDNGCGIHLLGVTSNEYVIFSDRTTFTLHAYATVRGM